MRKWTHDETDLARQMIERGDDEDAFLTQFGKSKKSAIARVDRVKDRPKTRACPNIPTSGRVDVPDHVQIEATQRASAPRSLTAILCGDPPVGYTQLDRRGS